MDPDNAALPTAAATEYTEATSEPLTPTNTIGETKVLTSKKLSPQDYPILWWTQPEKQEDQVPESIQDCGLPYTCTVSYDRGRVDRVGTIIFSREDLLTMAMVEAGVRNHTQAWVLHSVLDGPLSKEDDDALSQLTARTPPQLTHLWSHSFESDFVETAFTKLSTTTTTTTTTKAQGGTLVLDRVTAAPKVELQKKNRMRALGREQGGKAAVAWIVEECESISGRENYVRELVKSVDVDIYGPCMNTTAWPVHKDTTLPFSKEEVIAEYKFLLALERVHCKDFISEDYALALAVGTVPVVDGPQDYSRFAPTEQAIVHLKDYIAPELLAQDLDAMDKDDGLYLKRLEYRTPEKKSTISTLFQESFAASSLAAEAAPSMDIHNDGGTKAILTSIPDSFPRKWSLNRQGALCGMCEMTRQIVENSLALQENLPRYKEIINLATGNGYCDPASRYLPGLPDQMKAYDSYLESENQKTPPTLLSPDSSLPLSPPSTDSISSHSLNLTVTLSPTIQAGDPDSKDDSSQDNEGTDDKVNPATTWIQPGAMEGHLPPQDLVQSLPLAAVAAAAAGGGVDTIQEQDTMAHSPPASEMYYLLILILVLFLGMGALVLMTSKRARKVLSWPLRHLFYAKVPSSAQEAHSLERVMLRELGEDLLYD